MLYKCFLYSNSHCFVDYYDEKTATAALKTLNGVPIDGEVVEVCYIQQIENGNKESPPSKIILVRNLSFLANENDLRDKFKDCTAIRIATTQDTGKSRG